jgi:two-component system sensor histidine kinase YesM
MNDEIGCGTWNVHHRLLYQFGEGSGLTFEQVPGGGLRVTVTWRRNHMLAKDDWDIKGV